MTIRGSLSALVLACAACAVACGTKAPSLGLGGGSAGDDSSDGGGQTESDASVFTTSGDDSGGFLETQGDGGNACAFSTNRGQQQNLDVYVMLDQSLSMLGDKWNGVTAAINAFVAQPLTGVSVGIQYFALNLLSCTASDYATPEVEIAPLPGVASKITQSLAAHAPSTVTPTLAAEQGAIQHAQDWATKHPNDAVIVVLATDGDPDSCQLTPDPVTPVAQAAAMGVAGTPKILTFVIGVGNDLTNLNQIAMSGGTNQAYIVDTSMNVNQQFLDALNKIRGSALGCNYKIPAPSTGDTIDFGKVNVQFTANGKKQIFPQVADKAHCPSSGAAWYYDNPTSPAEIILCTSACGSVSAGGQVDILTGCTTVIK